MINKEFGTLYIVPTPIGNLSDISKRTLEILSKVDIILCEDTRKTLKLLSAFNIKNKLVSYYTHKEESESEKTISLLFNKKNIALVSDSGSPLISDPGNILIQKCIANKVNIISVPGPTAFVSALVASGFDLSQFIFYGFLKDYKKELNSIMLSSFVSAIYESPHKLFKTLELINEIMPDRNLCVAKEISKINESYYRGTANEILKMNIVPKGEFVIIIDKSDKDFYINDFDISLPKHLEYYVNQGLAKKEALKKVARDLNLPKNDIYKFFSND